VISAALRTPASGLRLYHARYDVLGRLKTTATANTSQWGYSWTYDGFGNRTQQTLTQGSGPTAAITVDAATNRISGTGYAYDANGNPTSYSTGVTLAYDVENRMTSYNSSVKYFYAPDNHRVWNLDASGNEMVWFYGPDGEQMGMYKMVLTGTTLSLSTQNTSVQFAGTPVTAQNQTVLVDRLGSVRQWGSTTTNYYPYGEEQGGGTTQGHTKFGTWYRDNTSYYDYAVNRYFRLGRFNTPDPYAGSFIALSPLSSNRYAFVVGDPVNLNDVLGLCNDSRTSAGSTNFGQPSDPPIFSMTVTTKAPPLMTSTSIIATPALLNSMFPTQSNPYGPPPSTPGSGGGSGASTPTGLQKTGQTAKDNMFGTHWCGPGGGGTPVNSLDTACQQHDSCYDRYGLTVGSNFNPFIGAQRAAQLYKCNQDLCNAAKKTSNLGATRVVLYFTLVPTAQGACSP
jgi:RHS repeat-associated protein